MSYVYKQVRIQYDIALSATMSDSYGMHVDDCEE